MKLRYVSMVVFVLATLLVTAGVIKQSQAAYVPDASLLDANAEVDYSFEDVQGQPLPENFAVLPQATSTSADISVRVADSPDPVVVGMPLTYEVGVVNNSTTTVAEQVRLRERLHPSVALVSTTGSCNENHNIVNCRIGDLDPGHVATTTIVVIPTKVGNLPSQARIRSATPDSNTDNNVAKVFTSVVAAFADLSVTKADSDDPVEVGDELTYNLEVMNAGPATSTGVVLTDRLPPSVNFVSATSTAGSCSQSGRVVECSLGDLDIGGVATTTIVVIPTRASTIVNMAYVEGDQLDRDKRNNRAMEKTVVSRSQSQQAEADLEVTKTDSADPVIVGQTFTYDIKVMNHGPATSTSVVLEDKLPSGVDYQSANASQGSCSVSSRDVVTCNLGDIAPGGMATVAIEVEATRQGNLNNIVEVSANERDPNRSNNKDTESTRVNRP